MAERRRRRTRRAIEEDEGSRRMMVSEVLSRGKMKKQDGRNSNVMI